MARIEADRDDLMHDVIALVRRIELHGKDSTSIVVGRRATGWLSLYLSGDEMYQFDDEGRLRRSYQHGFLFRTQGSTLARMRRERSDRETVLYRADLDPPALSQFRNAVHTRIRDLLERWTTGELSVVRAVPENEPALAVELQQAVRQVLDATEFLAPAIKR